MQSLSKRSLKTLKGLGAATYRLPWLTLSATRHVVMPVGWRMARSVQQHGLKDAHWNAVGDGMVRFFQDSGPVLTKLGQIMATRTDVLPPAVCRRLEALYNQQPAMTPKQLRALLNAAYGRNLPFVKFERSPIAVGSVGQVHRATLTDDSNVIVKILRPGSAAQIRRDMATLLALTEVLSLLMGKSYKGTFRMIERTLEDLEAGFLSELNLKNEASAMERFRKQVRSNKKVYVPKVYKNISSQSILVIEEIKGEPLSKFKGRGAKASKELAETVLREILVQIFDAGQFHADPHAGNFLVMEDGRLGMIDFGLTGEFTSQDRKKIARAVKAVMARDPDKVIAAFLEFGSLPKDFKVEKFKRDVTSLLRQKKVTAASLSNGASPLDQLVNELFNVAYRHGVHVPRSTTLLIKTLVTVEGVARSLDPDVKLLNVAAPVILRSLTPRWLRFLAA